jgi:hypothetical protein
MKMAVQNYSTCICKVQKSNLTKISLKSIHLLTAYLLVLGLSTDKTSHQFLSYEALASLWTVFNRSITILFRSQNSQNSWPNTNRRNKSRSSHPKLKKSRSRSTSKSSKIVSFQGLQRKRVANKN